jgi:DNA-binding XRE family transcriptional regulator
MAHPLAEARKSAEFSQQALADLASVDRVTIARIETGRYRASLDTVEKIINALRTKSVELSADAFLTGSAAPAMERAS